MDERGGVWRSPPRRCECWPGHLPVHFGRPEYYAGQCVGVLAGQNTANMPKSYQSEVTQDLAMQTSRLALAQAEQTHSFSQATSREAYCLVHKACKDKCANLDASNEIEATLLEHVSSKKLWCQQPLIRLRQLRESIAAVNF